MTNTTALTDDELRRHGIGEPAIALRRRGLQVRIDARVPSTEVRLVDPTSGRELGRIVNLAVPPRGPVRLTLPWSALASDNERHTRIAAHSKRYVAARQRAHDLAAEQWGERAPFAGRVALHVVFYPPNAQRRDIANFAKLIGDTLSGVAYADDAQIDRLVMERCAPDVDRPRAEMTVEEIC